MRLPALDGQSQPIASTSGRCDEPMTTYCPSMRGRERGAVLRRALIAPVLSPVLASCSRKERKLCISTASSNETQGTRLESPQVVESKSASNAIPEYWTRHLKKIRKGDERRMKRYIDKVAEINGLEPNIASLSDAQLAAKTAEFRQMIAGGKGLDDLLPEAFAVVREASRRVLNMRHFDVQLIGGMALHEGSITEMATGEGKTLAATLPAYLNALSGKGVHIVTVNDYLAKRDSEWMGKIYHCLGLTVGMVQTQHSQKRRRGAFGADITYVTSNALGFTHLTDTSTCMSPDDLAIARPFNYAIVDEADSVLIDDCITPLIMSSAPDRATKERYIIAQKAIRELEEQVMGSDSDAVVVPGDFVIDRHSHHISLTPRGMLRVLQMLVQLGHEFVSAQQEDRPPTINDLWEDEILPLGPYVITALCAREIHHRDVHYIVRDGEIKIVSTSTGRVLSQSRWMDGLHQAIEAQEPGVEIKGVAYVVCSITYQTLFKYYPKLSGMTGTAINAQEEFLEVYGLNVIQIPTHRPSRRVDHPPRVYISEKGYLDMLYMLLKTAENHARPVLLGTVSIADSEYFSRLLSYWKVPHQLLNARPQYIRREAKVIAQAGVPGVITIATNMAGRGVDILMGGNSSGLAQMALEQLVFQPYLSEQEWELEYDNLPSFFDEFRGDETMRKRLPPQLYGAIKRVQALVAAGLGTTVESSRIQGLVQAANQQAEQLHQRIVALHGLSAGKRDFEQSWQQMAHILERSELGNSGREDLNGAAVKGATIGQSFESELVKALLALWLYFDIECAASADHVRMQGGLQVLVLAIQESERVDRQLKGRAGRQGDPGETYSLVRVDDPLTRSAGVEGGLQLIQPFLKGSEEAMPYMSDGPAELYISALRRARERGRQDARLRLARADETVEVFRDNKVQLRMQLLTGTLQERRCILRAAIMDFAQWLVKANINVAHPPCDREWNLEAIICQLRSVVNRPTEDKVPMPKNKQMVRMLRDILKVDELQIPVAPAWDVLGPETHSVTAHRLRRALIMRPRDPDFGPVAGVDSALQAELTAHLALQRERAELEGSGFTGRWRGGAEALVLHVAASLVVAFEQLKEGPIMEAFTKWKMYYTLASEDADFKPKLQSEEQLREQWERTYMIQVLDSVWAEFIMDVDSLKTDAGVRAFAQLNPEDEFRLEASDLFLKTLRTLRQQWVIAIVGGPGLYVDLHVAEQDLENTTIDLDIGPPIHNLSEGLEGPGHDLEIPEPMRAVE